MPYEPFKTIHIISYLIWLIAFFASVFYFFKIRSATMDAKLKFMQTERKISAIGTYIGVIGIFLSGGAMASIKTGPKWGWFNFEHYAWLAWKQVLFFVILTLIFAFIMPAGKNLIRLIRTGASNDEIEGKWIKTYFFTLLVYALVWVNTSLGLYKPF